MPGPRYLRTCLVAAPTLAALGLAAAQGLAGLVRPLLRSDEAILLMGGRMVQLGERPYVDFWTSYTPLTYWLNALAFDWLGATVFAARLWQVLLYLAFILGLLAYARWRTRSTALAGCCALGGAMLTGSAAEYPWWNGAALMVLTLMLFARMRRTALRDAAATGGWLLVGLGVALTLAAKLNFGGYLLLAIGADLLRRWRTGKSRPAPGGPLVAAAVVLAAGLAFVLAHTDARPSLWEQLVVFPGAGLGPHRLRTVPPELALLVALPLAWLAAAAPRRRGLTTLVVAALCATLAYAAGQAPALHAWLPRLAPMLLAATALLGAATRLRSAAYVFLVATAAASHYVLSRADTFHAALLAPLWAALLPDTLLVLRRGWRSWPSRRRPNMRPPWRAAAPLAAGGLLALAGLPVASVPPPWRVLAGLAALSPDRPYWGRGDAALLMSTTPLGWPERAVLAGVERDVLRTADALGTGAVYVGLADHARTYTTNMRAYWALGRVPPVRSYELETGHTTETAVQREMITELAAVDGLCVVLFEPDVGDADFLRRDYVGSGLLDEFLTATFQQFAAGNAAQILVPAATPAIVQAFSPKTEN